MSPLPRLETRDRPPCHAGAAAALPRRARACRARHERGDDLVVPARSEQAELFGGGAEALALANPISSELSDMRPSLLPNLIAAAGRNVARGFADLALFEVGQIYAGDRPEDERVNAAGIRRGMDGPRHWAAKRRAVDLFDAKADAPGGARGARRAGRQAADRRRGPGLVSSRPRRRVPARPEEPARRLRRGASARARRDGRHRAARRLRDRPERRAAARRARAPRAPRSTPRSSRR